MNIIPWRKKDEVGPFGMDLDFDWNRIRDFFGRDFESRLPAAFASRSMPPVNLSETEAEYSVAVELPGLEEEDIHVQLMGNQLEISGERKWEEEQKDKEFHRVESQFGSFRRVVTLPEGLRLNPDDVDATYEKGILEVRFAKVEPTPASKIRVKAK